MDLLTEYILEQLWTDFPRCGPAERSVVHKSIIVSHPARPPWLDQRFFLLSGEDELGFIPDASKILSRKRVERPKEMASSQTWRKCVELPSLRGSVNE